MSYQYLDMDDSDDQNEGGRALELKYSIGYNSSMTGAVHNLTIKKKIPNRQKKFFIPQLTQELYTIMKLVNQNFCKDM